MWQTLPALNFPQGKKKNFRVNWDVLKYFEKLQQVDVEGVEPTAHAFPRFNVWDKDQSVDGFTAEEALSNAPKARNDQVVVPKVVEE